MISFHFFARCLLLLLSCTLAGLHSPTGTLQAADAPVKRSTWNGYERLDFTVDGRAALLVVPKEPAAGKPWIWRTEFFGHEPQGDVALLGKGLHVAYVDVQNLYGGPPALDAMDKYFDHVVATHGLSKKVVLEGFSRGGLFAFTWAARHPDRTAGIYVDAPVLDFKSWPAGFGKGKGSPGDWARCKKVYGLESDEAAKAYKLNPVDNLEPLAKAKIPILSICGDADDVVPVGENTLLVEERYKKLGGPIQVILKPGIGHHPHSLKDPAPIVDFVVKATSSEVPAKPTGKGAAVSRPKETPVSANARRPNIVVFLIDDLGANDLRCYGSQYFETPNLDRLAGQGIRCTTAYAAACICSPTRAALLTGRYPARLGLTDWIRARFQGGAIPSDKRNPTEYVGGPQQALLCPPNPFWLEHEELTIAEILKEQGYATGHVGKWHLGPDDWYPERQGFDFNAGGCDFGQPPSYFDPYSAPKVGGIPNLKPRLEGEHLADREGDEAADFLEKHRDQPFYLQVWQYSVHTPLMGKKSLIEKYKAKTPTKQKNATYAAMVESMDAAVGRVLAKLDELKLTDNTLVVFTSDNGGLVGPTDNSPLRSGKGFPYEGGTRVPLIVRWPGKIAAGQVVVTPMLSCDLLPTFLAATGTPLPKDRPIDGVNLANVWNNTGLIAPRDLFWHFPHYRAPVTPWSSIRSGNLKLIHWWQGNRLEMYDLGQDPYETTDIAATQPKEAARLDAKLQTWLKEVGAKLPRENPVMKR